MATVEEETTKALAEADRSSLSSEPAKKSPTLAARSSVDGQAGSGSAPDGNGVRVSDSKNEGLNGDMGSGGVDALRVVETEVLVGKETGKGLDSVLGVEEKEEEQNGVQKKIGAESDSAVLIGDVSDRMVGFNGNGISLLVEVLGSSLVSGNESEKKCGYEDDKGSLAENGGVQNGNFTEVTGSMPQVGGKRNITQEKGQKQDTNATGEENEDDDGENMGAEDLEYLVGDFVWGKIKGHPWWPGQIYDPSVASEYAAKTAKYNLKDRLLVAYFGDGSFSWCYPSQLKPFTENFGEMSKQSNSKHFVNAVQKALDEIGRIVELEMTCSCISVENQIGVARPLAVNAGIKAGVLVSEGGTGKLLIAQHEPAELLANMRYVAQVASITSMLKLTVLKSWLTTFYQAKGGYPLPIYHAPADIEGLEDKNRDRLMDTADFLDPVDVPIQGPFEEDWLSSPAGPGFNQSNQSLLQKCQAISDDKLYQRRKQKSVAELMGEDMDVEPKVKKMSMVKEGTQSDKSAPGKRKRKGNDEVEIQGISVLISPSVRKRGRKKKAEVSESPKATENKVSGVENGGVEGEEEANGIPMSKEWKMDDVSSVGNDDGGAKEETVKSSASRERKKSKYLCAPYTNPQWRVESSSSKRDSETESEKIAKIARMGERMTRAAGQLIGSPPIVKCSGVTFQKKHPKELGSRPDAAGSSGPQTAEQDHKKRIDSIDVNGTAKEVLSEAQAAAINPIYLRWKRDLDMMLRFILAFRSSIFFNGSNYKMYHSRRPGRKRKKLNFEAMPLQKDLIQTVEKHPEPRSQQTGNEMNQQAKSDVPKVKRVTRASGMKTNDNDLDRKASPVTLVLTFPPGFSLPSKDDLVKKYSKFGVLNETETDVFYNSYCARVVFVRSSDAEEAFNVSLEKSPFGAANVNYRLSSVASRARGLHQKTSSPLKKTPENPVASQPSDDEGSQLGFIRQKLEMMTSLLQNCDGRMTPEMKSSLEGEMKGLLEKVSAMSESTSS